MTPRAVPVGPPDLTLPHVAAMLRNASRAASLVPVLVGVLVLIGWARDLEVLKRIVPGLTAMNPATAIGFILIGWCLAIVSYEGRPAVRRAADAAAAATVALGASTILALLGVWDLRLDQVLFTEKLPAADFGRPNRMAPNTAVNFILIGAAVLVLDRASRKGRELAQILAAVAAMSSLLAVMGYAYGLPSFYGIGANIAMALPTALTFLVAAIGVLCARPTQGIMAVLSSDTSGGTLVRRLLPAVILVPAALGALRLAGERAAVFDTSFGVWVLAVAIMTTLALLVAWIARLLYRSDLAYAVTERALTHQATHDALTGLPNRALFVARLHDELGRSEGFAAQIAILFIDLDLFKVVNDSLGHPVGDRLLVAAGRRIGECLEPDDLVSRLGGDEFTVLVAGSAARHRAADIAERVRRAFDEPFTIGLHEVFTSVSIGVAVAHGHETADDLIRHADIAMYSAKARGRARAEVFDASMDAAARNRQELESDLRRALARDELRVYYQPEVDIGTGRIVGMEALVRWEHPQRGIIAPSEFIAVAEETGLIVRIGGWVLYEACRQARDWQAKYHRDPPLMVSVNLSGKHLQQATLIDEVAAVLGATGLDPAHLVLEITETVAMAGAETTIAIMSRLKALGVRLAIDDFGTGFSSLAYLKRFPVDLLKIDKTFVHGVARHDQDRAIVEAIIALGHALGLTVIAEGVETPDQLQHLRALGSELGQGYFFGRPLSDDASKGMPSLLEAHGRWREGEH